MHDGRVANALRSWGADVADETTLAAMVEAARQRWGRVDILHYNVGVGIACGDAPLNQITEVAFDRYRHHQPARRHHGL